jgi:hypothetical protein
MAIKNNYGSSGYLNHILNIGQAYGNITNKMKDIKIG